MRLTKAGWLAWALCALGLLLALAGPLQMLRLAGGAARFADLAPSVPGGLFAIVFGLVGALIVSRQPRQPIGWLVLMIGPCYSGGDVLNRWSASLPAAAPLSPVTLLLLWLGAWSWWLLVIPLLLIVLLFPTGRLLSPRWRAVVVLLALSFVCFLLSFAFTPTITLPNATTPVRNPVGFMPEPLARIFNVGFDGLLLVSAIGSAAAIFLRYRRAGRIERQQIKWFFYAGALFVAMFIAQFSLSSNSSDTSNTIDVAGVLFLLAILGIPLAIGIAILRYRLWDIDVIIRRTLVYALLTALLALAYFGSVLVLQSLFGVLTGESQSTLVTVLSTLVIAALFVPLRARVQRVIDRRFYRRKYDAARTLAAFSAHLRDGVDLEALTDQLLATVDETMQPQTISVWLNTPPSH